MKLSKRFGLFATTSILTLALFGCSSDDGKADVGKEEPKEKTYVFASGADTIPFGYLEKGVLTGFDIELLNAIAKEENFKVKYKEMSFNGIIPALQGKQVDGAVAAMTIREDRLKVVDFSDPYFEAGLVLVAKKGSGIKSVEDLKGKTIVAKQGTASYEKAQEIAKKYGAKVKTLEGETTLYLDVQKGGSDALINDYPFVSSKLKTDKLDDLEIVGDRLTGDDSYGIAITKGNKELLKLVNDGLEEIKANGEYDKIYKKYFGE